MGSITLNPQYDPISKVVSGTLLIEDIPEVASVVISLFKSNEAYKKNQEPESAVELEPTDEEIVFSFSNMPKSHDYFIKADVITAYQTFTVERGTEEVEVTEEFEIDKFAPEKRPFYDRQQDPKPERRTPTIDSSFWHREYEEADRIRNKFMDGAVLTTNQVSGASSGKEQEPTKYQLLTLDFTKDTVILGGTGDLVYLGGGNRVLEETSSGFDKVLQAQNELTPGILRVIEGWAKNFLKPFSLTNGVPTDWSVECPSELVYSVLTYPFDFTNTLHVEAYNFSEPCNLVLKSNQFPFSNVQPLAVNFEALIRLDSDIQSSEVTDISQLTFKTKIRYYNDNGNFRGEQEFSNDPTDFDSDFGKFHQVISSFPEGGTKAELILDVGLLYPGNRAVLMVTLADINQIGTETTPILGSSVREGDVYRVQWRENFSFTQGAILIEFIPTSNLPSVIFDTETFRCFYDGKLNFVTGASTLSSGNISLAWLEPCLSIEHTPPTSPITGNRYLINVKPTGIWIHHKNEIAEWNGTAWDYTIPQAGECIGIGDLVSESRQPWWKAKRQQQFVFDGANWTRYNEIPVNTITLACCYGGDGTDRRILLNGIEIAADSNYNTALEAMTSFICVGCSDNRENQINGIINAFAVVPVYEPHKHRAKSIIPYILSQWGHSSV